MSAPVRATWKGHGRPRRIVYYDRDRSQPAAQGIPVLVTSVRGTVRLWQRTDAGLRELENFGASMKFWATVIRDGAR